MSSVISETFDMQNGPGWWIRGLVCSCHDKGLLREWWEKRRTTKETVAEENTIPSI